jgi:hypothetical protein
MQHRKGRPVPGQFCRPGRGEYEQAAACTVPREPQQHLPHCVVAAVNVVEDYDDRPVRTSGGEQAGNPLDEVVAKSCRARSRVVGYIGTAHERWKPAKPAPAYAADSIRIQATCMQVKSVGPGTEGRHTLEETIVRDQPDGELTAVRYQFGREPRFSQPRVAEHQGHSKLTERAPLLFGSQHSEFPDASRHETPIAAHIAE